MVFYNSCDPAGPVQGDAVMMSAMNRIGARRASRAGSLARLSVASAVLMTALAVVPAHAQQNGPAPDTPARAEQTTPDAKRQGDAAKTEKPSKSAKPRRQQERAPEPGCPAIGDKLELLV